MHPITTLSTSDTPTPHASSHDLFPDPSFSWHSLGLQWHDWWLSPRGAPRTGSGALEKLRLGPIDDQLLLFMVPSPEP